jgi:hypothetical protein
LQEEVVEQPTHTHTHPHHPRSLGRVDCFGYAIPIALADDCGRFVEEAENCTTLRVAIRSARAEACTLESVGGRGGVTAGGAQVHLPPVRGATPPQLAEEAEEGAGGGGAEGHHVLSRQASPTRTPVPRTMSRRAASDAALVSALADVDGIIGIGGDAAAQPGFSAALRSLSAVERTVVDGGGAGAAGARALAKDGTEGLPYSPPPHQLHQLPPLDEEEGIAEVVALLSARLRVQAASEGGNEAMAAIAARTRAAQPPLSFPPKAASSGGSGSATLRAHPALPRLLLGELPLVAPQQQQQTQQQMQQQMRAGAAISEPGSGGGGAPGGGLSPWSGGPSSGMHLPNIREDRASAPPALSAGGAAAEQQNTYTRRMSLPGRARPRGSGAGAAPRDQQQGGQGVFAGLARSAGGAPLPFRHTASMPLLRHDSSLPRSLPRSSSSLRPRTRGASDSDSGALSASGGSGRRTPDGAAGKAAALGAVVREESTKLLRCEQMLGMYVNRANAAWAQRQAWRAPAAVSEAEQRAFQASDEYTVFKADLVRKLRAGHVAFQVYAAEDELALPDGQLLDVWTAE